MIMRLLSNGTISTPKGSSISDLGNFVRYQASCVGARWGPDASAWKRELILCWMGRQLQCSTWWSGPRGHQDNKHTQSPDHSKHAVSGNKYQLPNTGIYFLLFEMVSTYDHRVWKTGLPVRSAVLKPHAGRLVVGWVTTSESRLLYVFLSSPCFLVFSDNKCYAIIHLSADNVTKWHLHTSEMGSLCNLYCVRDDSVRTRENQKLFFSMKRPHSKIRR